MDMPVKCGFCGRSLLNDEVGLMRKIFESDAKRGVWRCLTCMADYLECEEDELREKIEEFKSEGCKLFS